MVLQEVQLRGGGADLPAEVLDVCIAAEERARQFVEQRAPEPRIAEFQASNVRVAYRVLRELVDRNLVAGRALCEWGSGLGGVTCLASILGFDSCGIEVEVDLVAEARRLACDFELPTRFFLGSFKPAGAYRGELGMDEVERSLGIDPTGFDVVYAYPWPAEERVVFDLFTHGAPEGSLLVTYHGGGTIRVHRKTRGSARGPRERDPGACGQRPWPR